MHRPTSSRPLRSTGLALAISAAVGCGPYPTMQGVVRAAHDRCAPAAGDVVAMGAPLPSATVRVLCPGEGQPLAVAETDGEGRFQGRWGPPRAIPMRCVIHLEKPGYVPRDIPVADVCTSRSRGGSQEETCHLAAVVAELAAVGGAP
jgi:hypothetical protein